MYARLYAKPTTVQQVELEVDKDNAPDVYVHKYCVCEEGDVYFVEVAETEDFTPSQLWRCEVVNKDSFLMLATVQATVEEVERELAEKSQEPTT